MTYIHGEKELADLLQHDLVKPLIDTGMYSGLTGGTKVDYALGAVERAVEAEKNNLSTKASELRERYTHLREINPLRYGPKIERTLPIEPKNSTYSARRSMNS